jgi:predicted nucleic acid-binding protein
MAFVIDASIAANWYFDDERDARADAALALLNDGTALAPLQWWFEVHNVILLGERRKRGSEQHSADFLATLHRMSIELSGLPDHINVLALARKHRLTFYDAAYLELAKRERLPLATLDNALANAARTEGIALI